MTLQGSESLRLARHDRLVQLDKHQAFKIVVVSCEFSSHWRQLYFLLKLFKIPQCQFCTKILEMSDLCYLRKPQMSQLSEVDMLNENNFRMNSFHYKKGSRLPGKQSQ